MRRLIPLLVLASLQLVAGPASDLARAIRENSLDRGECYRVRDLTLVKGDIRIYLTDGYLIFGKPVMGRPIAAVFTTDVENGDGEVLLLPPTLAERRSLASFTGVPNLDDHFQDAIFLFTGDVYHALLAELPENPTNRKVPEMGALLEERWNPVLRTISESYDTRLTLDLMNGAARKPDLFTGLFHSPKLGNFDLIFDPDNPDQIAAGQVSERTGRTYFDIWTQFPTRTARTAPAPPHRGFTMSDFRIQATIQPDLTLDAVTRVKVRTDLGGAAAVPFEIAEEMRVSQVTVQGAPAEVLQRDELRSNIGHGANSLFLVVPSSPLRPGVDYEFEFHHSGKIILESGDRVFYVTARGNWYPTVGQQFATFDLTFRYPRNLELVTPGDVVEDRTEGDWRITRRRPSAPIRLAGFNLGSYIHARVSRGGFQVDVCANRALEPELQPRPVVPPLLPATPPVGRRRPPFTSPSVEVPPPPPPLSPVDRLHAVAEDIASGLEFMSGKFGAPALPHLTVSPIPGNFGQGFPGLIYLSTRSYVDPRSARIPPAETRFFDELLAIHETAHQWWGGVMTSASYRDDWIMEALANYSALLFLEKRDGERDLAAALDSYRAALLAKRTDGEPIDSSGPIVLGTRLENSVEPRAWNAITYGKGSWILQMLRRRMGTDSFYSMLGEMLHRYRGGIISTEEFRALAARFLPPKSDDPQLESFFDQWVYGTGIPTLKLAYSLKGSAPKLRLVGTLTQTDVPDDFSALTPVEIQLARGRTIVRWVRSSNEPVTFTVPLQQRPSKVSLDPHYAVLRR